MTKTILILEDDHDLRFLYSTALIGAGYKVLHAKTSAEASAILENPATSLDLALLDMAMPDIPGTHTVETIRNHDRFAEMPIIVITANEHYEERLSSKVERFFVKPIAIGDVLEAVKALI
jgi:two-component system OmpR family response regulator